MASLPGVRDIQVIELHMVDKRKYFPLTMLSGFTIRGILYPFSLIKTRLQVQRNSAQMYKGTYDAFTKITKTEGIRGLYKGFWISNCLIVSQMSYITTYEGVRHYLKHYTNVSDNKVRSLVAGGCASLVGQTFMVPIDIVSQHLQLSGISTDASVTKSNAVKPAQLHVGSDQLKSRFGAAKAIIDTIYHRDGIRGFYKGYLASLSVYAPNSAMWWFFYDFYCGMVAGIAPIWIPRLALQCMAAPMSGISTTILTTPLDAIRARIQVENGKFITVARELWKEERWFIFYKGLSARLVQSVTFSFCIILGYETIKRWSLLEQYKKDVRW